MTDDLTTRLRDDRYWRRDTTDRCATRNEAADRIEALEAEIDERAEAKAREYHERACSYQIALAARAAEPKGGVENLLAQHGVVAPRFLAALADDKTAAEHAAAERYPSTKHRQLAFVAGAAWQAEQAAVRRVAPDRETLQEIRDLAHGRNVAGIVEAHDLLDAIFVKAEAAIASGVFGVPADQVRAETLEALRRDLREADQTPWHVLDAIEARAAEYRKAAGA